ncbi:uncharacterized protein [Antedon mediterranea]|uniref:uncharacterized protein n=1 Tax=Antedon mediterranea TaxID=105859 RepID=UPI003AF6302A
MMGSPWDYSPSSRGNRGSHMGARPSPNPRFRGQSSGGYNQRNSPYGSPYSPNSSFSSPNHPHFSPHRGYHRTSSPRYGSPGQEGRGRGNKGYSRGGWNKNKGRGMNRGNWNGGGDISVYFSPEMLISPWKELERLHISNTQENPSSKDNQT